MDIPLPGGGVIKQPSLLPATIKKNKSAKEILDNIRKFTKENKSIIGRTTTGLGVAGGGAALLTGDEPDTTVKTMEELNKALLNQTQSDIPTKRDTSNLSSAQNYIMKSLQRGEMTYPEVSNMMDNPLMLQSVIDSVKEAQGFEHGGFHPPQKPRVGFFTLENQPSRFDRSMEANMFRTKLNSYNRALGAMQTTGDTLINPTATDSVETAVPGADLTVSTDPTIGIRTTEQAEDLTAVKALTADQVAGMTDEELDAYMNTFALDPNVVKVGEVNVVDESEETRKIREAVEASRKRGAPTTVLPIMQGLIPGTEAQPLMATMPDFGPSLDPDAERKLELYMQEGINPQRMEPRKRKSTVVNSITC